MKNESMTCMCVLSKKILNILINYTFLAASPLAPSGGPVGCTPPNHQVQLRCNTGGGLRPIF